MKEPKQMSRTAKLIECALMIALAFILSSIPLISLPWGGTITLFSTLPLIILSFRHGAKWGVSTAFVYSLLQLLQGMGNVLAVPAQTFFMMALCGLLDYVLAYTVVGFSGTIGKRFKNPTTGLIMGILLTGLMRYSCSVLSGALLWGEYAWGGWSIWPYSFVYNAAWCLPDIAGTLVASIILSHVTILHILPQKVPTVHSV